MSTSFVASAAVANRFLGVQIEDQDGNVLYGARSPAAVTAGLTATLFVSQRGGDTTISPVGGSVAVSLPDVPIPPGYVIRGSVGAIDVADQFGATFMEVEAAAIGADGAMLGAVDLSTLTMTEPEGI